MPPLPLDTRLTLAAAGVIFIWALLLGVVKYRQIARSPESAAHPYVDIAHRAALLYSFATAMIAAFVHYSDWPRAVDLTAVAVLLFFFAASIASYNWHGVRRSTDNQFRGAGAQIHAFMWFLIAGEIVSFSVVFAGFLHAQFA